MIKLVIKKIENSRYHVQYLVDGEKYDASVTNLEDAKKTLRAFEELKGYGK